MQTTSPEFFDDSGYNMYEDEDLRAIAGEDREYLARLAAAKMARLRLENDPGNQTLREVKQSMDVELIDFEYRTGRRQLPTDEMG